MDGAGDRRIEEKDDLQTRAEIPEQSAEWEGRTVWTIARGIRRLFIVVSAVLLLLGWALDDFSVWRSGGFFMALILVGVLWVGYFAGCWVAAGFRSRR